MFRKFAKSEHYCESGLLNDVYPFKGKLFFVLKNNSGTRKFMQPEAINNKDRHATILKLPQGHLPPEIFSINLSVVS